MDDQIDTPRDHGDQALSSSENFTSYDSHSPLEAERNVIIIPETSADGRDVEMQERRNFLEAPERSVPGDSFTDASRGMETTMLGTARAVDVEVKEKSIPRWKKISIWTFIAIIVIGTIVIVAVKLTPEHPHPETQETTESEQSDSSSFSSGGDGGGEDIVPNLDLENDRFYRVHGIIADAESNEPPAEHAQIKKINVVDESGRTQHVTQIAPEGTGTEYDVAETVGVNKNFFVNLVQKWSDDVHAIMQDDAMRPIAICLSIAALCMCLYCIHFMGSVSCGCGCLMVAVCNGFLACLHHDGAKTQAKNWASSAWMKLQGTPKESDDKKKSESAHQKSKDNEKARRHGSATSSESVYHE